MVIACVTKHRRTLSMAKVAVLPRIGGSTRSTRGVRLTPTEIKVLSLIGKGFSSKEAADRLIVSKRTVDFHLANIYEKLLVNNRVAALRVATRLGLMPFEPFFGHIQGEV